MEADREWIHEFDEEGAITVRELVVRARYHLGSGVTFFDVYQTVPTSRLITSLCLDEVLGRVALAICGDSRAGWSSLERQRAWDAKYRPKVETERTSHLEPWQRLLPERCTA